MHLSPAEGVLRRDTRDGFLRSGWAAVAQFYNNAETRRLRQYVDELQRLPERPGAQMLYRETSLLNAGALLTQRLENFCPSHARIDALVRDERLIVAVEELFGEQAILFKDKINYKAPGGAGFEPHQDQQAGWSRYAPLFITALVCIDTASVENGCLEIATAPRLSKLIGDEWSPLNAEQMAGLSFIAVPTRPGDVLFFDSFVVHRSQPNLTTRGRRVLYLTYNRAADGDHRVRYFADKRTSFPPDNERKPGVEYKYRV